MGEKALLDKIGKEIEHKEAMNEATVTNILTSIAEFRTQYVK